MMIMTRESQGEGQRIIVTWCLKKLLATHGVFKRTVLYATQVTVNTFKTAFFKTHPVSFASQSASSQYVTLKCILLSCHLHPGLSRCVYYSLFCADIVAHFHPTYVLHMLHIHDFTSRLRIYVCTCVCVCECVCVCVCIPS